MRNPLRYVLTRRRFLAGSAGAGAAIAASGCTSAQDTTSETKTSKLAIIHTNDTHGHDLLDKESLGLAAVAQLKADYQAKGYEVLLLDAGDLVQGEQLVGQSKGTTAIGFYNDVGYDAITLGNHEFDYGQDYIQKYAAEANFPILSANTIVDATGETLVETNTVFTLGDGRKVGVFGLTTPETYTSANVLFVRGITFLEEQKLYDCAQAQADELRKKGCDLVVCLAHLGEDEINAPNRASDVAQHVSGIDLIINGHDHKEENATLTDASGNPVLVVETGCFTHAIGVVTWENGKIAGTLVKYGEYDGQDAAVVASIQKVADEVNESLGEVIGTTAFFLDGNRDPGLRTQETNLGDFVADAMLWEAQLSAKSNPDAAFINGGGIRDSINEGDITLRTIHNVYSFINYLCTVEVTGAQLLEALEASCAACPNELGGFPQVAGIEFTIDTTVPYQKGENYPKTTHAKPANPGGRITITRVGNRDYNVDDTYVIASADFICNGGDTYYVFAESAQKTMEGTGYQIVDVLQYYLQDVCKGEMPEQYREAQGRITIKYA